MLSRRGEGQPLRVAGNTMIPASWNSFLHVSSNKEGLFKFLANSLMDLPPDVTVLTTEKEHVLTNVEYDVSNISPCSHEEADYRMILHAHDAYLKGYRKVLISANDTDVVVIAVAAVSALEGLELWVTFGRGQNVIYIPTHEIARKLGHQRSQGLLFLHAITGCDTVSAFNGIGKKTAWDVWTGMPHLWPLFQKLASAPVSVSEADIEEIERFVVVMYSRTSPAHKVNDARKQLFTNNNRHIETKGCSV